MQEIVSFLYTDALKQYLKELKDKISSGKPNTDCLRASSSGHCARKLWYQYHNTSPKLLNEFNDRDMPAEDWISLHKKKSRLMFTFELGYLIEDQLVKRLGDKIYGSQKELDINIGKHKISGHIDGLFKDSRGEEWIIDFKSINTKSYNYEVKKGKIDYAYKCQAHCYMYKLDIPRFKFVYYDKNKSDMMEVDLYYGQEIIDQVQERFDKVTSDNIPEREVDIKGKDKWKCSYCNYFDTCYKGIYKMVPNGKGSYTIVEDNLYEM